MNRRRQLFVGCWRRRIGRTSLALVVLAASAFATAADAPQSGEEEIDRWVKDLQSDSFIQRDFAARRLSRTSRTVVPQLESVTRDGSRSAGLVAVSLLEQWSMQDDEAGSAAHRALNRLSRGVDSLKPPIAKRVQLALRRADRRVVGVVTALGGSIERDPNLNITVVRVNNEQFGDDQARVLARLGSLEQLDLRKTGITDQSLNSLATLSGLQTLNLSETIVTAAGLRELTPLSRLTRLSLYHTKITPEDYRWFMDHLPDCEIRQ